MTGLSRNMGRYYVLRSGGLPVFGMVIMTYFIQMTGKSKWLRERMKREVKYEIPDGLRLFRWGTVKLSETGVAEFEAVLIALETSAREKSQGYHLGGGKSECCG